MAAALGQESAQGYREHGPCGARTALAALGRKLVFRSTSVGLRQVGVRLPGTIRSLDTGRRMPRPVNQGKTVRDGNSERRRL